MYIIFEGVIGVGKTSASKALYEWFNAFHPEARAIYTREPGGTQIAEAIRVLVQGTEFDNDVMDPITEAYLYAASRAQSLRKIVLPALVNKKTVISDRSFLTSMANQGLAQGLSFERILEINSAAIGGAWPSLVIQLVPDDKLTLEMALNRAFDGKGDKFERMGIDFYERVTHAYIEMAKLPSLKPIWRTVPASGSKVQVKDRVVAIVEEFLTRT